MSTSNSTSEVDQTEKQPCKCPRQWWEKVLRVLGFILFIILAAVIGIVFVASWLDAFGLIPTQLRTWISNRLGS